MQEVMFHFPKTQTEDGRRGRGSPGSPGVSALDTSLGIVGTVQWRRWGQVVGGTTKRFSCRGFGNLLRFQQMQFRSYNSKTRVKSRRFASEALPFLPQWKHRHCR